MIKKITLLSILLIITSLVYSQGIIEGYKDLPWKSTPEKVMEKYPDLKQTSDFTEKETPYITYSDNSTILFNFYENQLATVKETFENQTEDEIDILTENLLKNYPGNLFEDEKAKTPTIQCFGLFPEGYKSTIIMLVKTKTEEDLYTLDIMYVYADFMFFL